MITFIISLIALIVGFALYGTLVERIFGIQPERQTPALTRTDGVDFVPMSPWRIFLVQFLNIAGLGPIYGAIMGIYFGPAAFLWIVFGTIFAGGVHDYMSGMLSVRKDGVSLPDIVGDELGRADVCDVLDYPADYYLPLRSRQSAARLVESQHHHLQRTYHSDSVGAHHLCVLCPGYRPACR